MESLSLFMGHLTGDYLLQNDWMAANKPKSHLACAVHCLCYTLGVLLCTFWWLNPWWCPVIFAAHYPLDRYKCASWWMRNVSRQNAFAEPPFFPWSIVLIDNTAHLLVLYIIGLIQLRVFQ